MRQNEFPTEWVIVDHDDDDQHEQPSQVLQPVDDRDSTRTFDVPMPRVAVRL